MIEIPIVDLPIQLPTNANMINPNSSLKLGLCLHLLDNPKYEKSESFNQLNTRFHARTTNTPPWLQDIKPGETYSIEISNVDNFISFKGFCLIEKVIQSQWELARKKLGYVLEGSLFYDSLKSHGNSSDPFVNE